MSLGLLSANFLKHSLFLYPPFGDFRSPSSHSGAWTTESMIQYDYYSL